MAGINARVVRRSNALQGWAYGRRFRYREVTSFGTGPAGAVQAAAVSAALKAMTAGMAFRPSQALLGPLVSVPGGGPNENIRPTRLCRISVRTLTPSRLADHP